MNLAEYVTVNGTRYRAARLSELAKQHLAAVSSADADIVRLRQRLSVYESAKACCVGLLKASLDSKQPEPAVSPSSPAPKKRSSKRASPKNLEAEASKG